MKEYTYRRTTYYALRGHNGHPDDHANFDIVITPTTVVEDAVKYLVDGTSYLRFPGAARAVAIAAADFISRQFDEDFYLVLNDPQLMHGNDPYFRVYSEEKDVYDKILAQLPRENIYWNNHRMQITLSLLQEEYMLDAKGLKILGRNNL